MKGNERIHATLYICTVTLYVGQLFFNYDSNMARYFRFEKILEGSK
jgi:hypothetical protein